MRIKTVVVALFAALASGGASPCAAVADTRARLPPIAAPMNAAAAPLNPPALVLGLAQPAFGLQATAALPQSAVPAGAAASLPAAGGQASELASGEGFGAAQASDSGAAQAGPEADAPGAEGKSIFDGALPRRAAGAPGSPPYFQDADPVLAQEIHSRHLKLAVLKKAYDRALKQGRPPEDLAAIRRKFMRLHGKNFSAQMDLPVTQRFFGRSKPGAMNPEVARLAAANLGVRARTLGSASRLASDRLSSLERVLLKDKGLMPNEGKGYIGKTGLRRRVAGTSTHIYADGSPNLVSVTRQRNPGTFILNMGLDGRAPMLAGLEYELGKVEDAIELPHVFARYDGPFWQQEFMVPKVPADRIKSLRRWEIRNADRSRIEPGSIKPGHYLYVYSDAVRVDSAALGSPEAAAYVKELHAALLSSELTHEIPFILPDQAGK